MENWKLPVWCKWELKKKLAQLPHSLPRQLQILRWYMRYTNDFKGNSNVEITKNLCSYVTSTSVFLYQFVFHIYRFTYLVLLYFSAFKIIYVSSINLVNTLSLLKACIVKHKIFIKTVEGYTLFLLAYSIITTLPIDWKTKNM